MTEQRKVVAFDRGRRRPDPARVSEFAATARRLQREREEAGDVIARLLRETPRGEWSGLAGNVALRNSGALDRLGKEVSARLEREPQEALALSNLATAIAETLSPDAYPAVVIAQLRAHAWKDRGQALEYVGKYDEALAALDRAEALLAPFGTVAHDRAIVRYVRATTLQQMNRLDEAIDLLHESKAVFLDYGDMRLYLYCGIVEGTQLFRRAEFSAAAEVFAPLLEAARAIDDVESEARIHNNLGFCAIELGNLTSAETHLAAAAEKFRALGRDAEALRTELGSARLLVSRGHAAHGLMRLRDVRSRLLANGLVEEAGLCGLDLAEVLLARGAVDDARQLASEIVQQFHVAHANRRAVEALHYLEETIAAHDATPDVVRHVHAYLDALRNDPIREFVAYAG